MRVERVRHFESWQRTFALEKFAGLLGIPGEDIQHLVMVYVSRRVELLFVKPTPSGSDQWSVKMPRREFVRKLGLDEAWARDLVHVFILDYAVETRFIR